MNWEHLTDGQRRVAEGQEPIILVFGRAGTGKTTVALWSARRFLESTGAKKWHRVLFLTFSRTAVREIARRSGRALTGFTHLVEIQTFHSFSHRLIAAFGRYAGLGGKTPALQSDAEAKLMGQRESELRYDDLLPLALKVLQQQRVWRLAAERWPLVICDEFHDTDDLQWDLLSCLSKSARLVLFADPNQMIYDSFLGHRGVGPRRVEQARTIANLIVDLGTPSHRDPSNVIPAMAEAVRQREFRSPTVSSAIQLDRLRIHKSVPDERLLEVLLAEIESARKEKLGSIGVFGHTNRAVANLSVDLINAGVDHVLVGLPEAHGEALATLEVMCLHGLRRVDLEQVRHRLAVFLTASVRGQSVPPLAMSLLGRTALPSQLLGRITDLSRALQSAGDAGFESLVRIACEGWARLGITAGKRPWSQAVRCFTAIAYQAYTRSRGSEELLLVELSRQVSELRSQAMLDLDLGTGYPIQVMNFHQTKGREAHVVILVYRDSDWFGREAEPYLQNSRLLYVSLTRARVRNVILLPEHPHPLVSPFADLV